MDTSFEAVQAVLPCSALWIHHHQQSLRTLCIEVGYTARLGDFHLAGDMIHRQVAGGELERMSS